MSEETHADAAARDEEARRLKRLRTIVDLTTAALTQDRMTREEALHLVAAARRRILELFPDKQDVYELVLAPRLARLVREHTVPPADILRFPTR
jgi:hypothetical protein